jgi:hypothetical protein
MGRRAVLTALAVAVALTRRSLACGGWATEDSYNLL